MSFGTRLRDKRKELGITQPQLAEILGVSQSAIGSWETDTNSPRATLLYDLFDILHCDANYLFQDETKELYKDKATPSEFENIIKKYRDLDDHGKEMVDFTLQKEWERSTDLIEKNNIVKLTQHLEAEAAHNEFADDEEQNTTDSDTQKKEQK
ncbi:MAG: helix-turn-helix domain-containing protein [Coprococcus phoceensis]